MVERATLGELESATKYPVFTDNPRTVRVDLDPGETVEEHDHPGTDIVFHVLEGAMELRLDDERYDLSGGDMLQFDGERTVAGEASEATTVVVVLAQRPE
jgi:quercetin dioxygenase-like cupin family protein